MSKTKNAAVVAPTAAPTQEPGTPSGPGPVLRRDSDQALWEALRAHPDSTTAALAHIARIGLSTARRLLSQWETTGYAQSRTDPDTPRAAKTWTQGAGTPATVEPDPAPAAPEPAAPEPVSLVMAEPVESSPETSGPAPEPATVAVAEVPALHSAEARALWEALESHPGSTTAELAKMAAIETIAARHLLTEWELAGAVWAAIDPGNPGAGNWTAGAKPDPAPAAPAVTGVSDTAPAEPEPVPAAPATPEAVVPEPAAPAEQTGPADPAPDTTAETPVAAPTGDEPAAGAPQPPAAADNGAAADAESTAERLPAGALRGQVEDFLRENPGKEFTPHQIGKALNRSSGAVHNALVKLTDGGTARQTSTAPKKFTLAS
ncbi:hypothetical protein IU469_14305 [Nocardia puris]|uniref:hypothetical protein n=1 Tax=Nocardia puris TaxID=208602 RepID=UPI00189548E1|nr:hypothetical protein [Nocardia puris]MBF6366888.1 hypothetical protein [Nocardia puris]